MAAIAVIGILSWIVVASQTGATRGVTVTKLESDVITLNQAVKVYIANGGSLTGITDPQAVLDKMKTKLSATDDAKQVGFGGAMVDPRLAVRAATAEETQSSQKRAIWNVAHLRFDIATSGAGVAEFFLDDVKGKQDYGTDSRLAANSALEYDTGNGWIWRYRDGTPQPKAAPTLVSMSTTGSGGTPPSPQPPPTRIQLQPPSYSQPSGAYPLSQYNFAVSIANPNTSSTSWVMYSLNGGTYTRYSGAFDVAPGTRVSAFVTGDSYLYYSSSTTGAVYTAKPPVELTPPVISPSRSQFQWTTAETVSVTLENPNDPKVSSMEYSLDGSSWLAYSGPFDLSIENYSSGATILARALPLTKDYLMSPATSATVQGPPPPVQLESPEITPTAPNFMAGTVETIQVTLRDPNPIGSKLEYRLPGAPWKEYTSPLELSRTSYPTGLLVEARAKALSRAYLTSEEVGAGLGLTPVQLQSPLISPSAPNFMADSMETITVTIQYPNAAGSALEYRIAGGDWKAYSTQFQVTRSAYATGVDVEARARATDAAYQDSATASSAIGLTPVKLQAPIVAPSAPDFVAGSVETVLVTLTDRNSAGSTLEYRVAGGAWQAYQSPFSLSRSAYPTGAAIEARATTTSPAYLTSDSSSCTVGLTPVQLQTPPITPSAATFIAGSIESISVTLSDPNPEGSTLEYRLNGGEWQGYSNAFSVTRAIYPTGLTVEARARSTSPAYLTSGVASASLGLTPVQLQAPAINPSARTFVAGSVESISVSLTNPNPAGSTLEYRLNGGSWLAYNTTFNVLRSTYPTGLTIEARAHSTSPAYLDSAVTSASIGLDPVQLQKPVITPSAPNFMAVSVESISVRLTDLNLEGSALDYRLNGGSWIAYGSPFNVTRAAYATGLTVEARARATTPAHTNSDITSGSIGLTPVKLQNPRITPSSPNFIPGSVDTISVTLTSLDPGRFALDYRLNGGAWQAYSSAFTVTRANYPAGLTVEARARSTSPAYLDSGISSASIGLTPAQLKAPVISPSASNFMAGSVETITVTLTNPNPTGSALDYRINGGSWVAYSNAFSVTRATYPTGLTVEARARATSSAYTDSPNSSSVLGLTPIKLLTPTISPKYPNFIPGSVESITVTITNPNKTGSTLEYQINNGTWKTYSSSFSVSLTSYPSGLTVNARARATSVAYSDSDVATSSIGVSRIKLKTPIIHNASPTFVVSSCETISVKIVNPNSSSVSVLEYRLNGSAWKTYTGSFSVTRYTYPSGVLVESRARATAANYTDSDLASAAVGVKGSNFKKVSLMFASLTSDGWYLNDLSMYINGDRYWLGNNDLTAGNFMNIDLYVDTTVRNAFNLVIDTYERDGSGNYISGAIRGLDTRTGSGYTMIGDNASFSGTSAYTTKYKDLGSGTDFHMQFGYEDMIATGGSPDYDYNDLMFELKAYNDFHLTFGD